MTEVSERVSVLVREEIELAKVEVTQKAMSLARGAAAMAFAAVFGLLAIAWAINSAFNDTWQGFVIVFGLLIVLAIAAGLFAWRKLKVATPPTPTMAIDEAKKIRDTVAAGSEGS
ncbi:MAG TPA: phage holin family protein [Candidatus Limnocylindria bacterium]|nr:phage holin family protein [Candidatus Limnocylindria bacterium]